MMGQQLSLGACEGCATLGAEVQRLRDENARLRHAIANTAAPHVMGSETSLAGAQTVRPTAAAKRATILALFDTRPEWTCAEIETATGFLHQSASARIRELVQNGLLFTSGKRVNPATGVSVNNYRRAT